MLEPKHGFCSCQDQGQMKWDLDGSGNIYRILKSVSHPFVAYPALPCEVSSKSLSGNRIVWPGPRKMKGSSILPLRAWWVGSGRVEDVLLPPGPRSDLPKSTFDDGPVTNRTGLFVTGLSGSDGHVRLRFRVPAFLRSKSRHFQTKADVI